MRSAGSRASCSTTRCAGCATSRRRAPTTSTSPAPRSRSSGRCCGWSRSTRRPGRAPGRVARDAARRLSAQRDQAVMAETFESLVPVLAGSVAPQTMLRVRAGLVSAAAARAAAAATDAGGAGGGRRARRARAVDRDVVGRRRRASTRSRTGCGRATRAGATRSPTSAAAPRRRGAPRAAQAGEGPLVPPAAAPRRVAAGDDGAGPTRPTSWPSSSATTTTSRCSPPCSPARDPTCSARTGRVLGAIEDAPGRAARRIRAGAGAHLRRQARAFTRRLGAGGPRPRPRHDSEVGGVPWTAP